MPFGWFKFSKDHPCTTVTRTGQLVHFERLRWSAVMSRSFENPVENLVKKSSAIRRHQSWAKILGARSNMPIN